MCRSLSTTIVKYNPKDDSLIQDNKQSHQDSKTHRRGFLDIYYNPFYPLKRLGFGLDQLLDNPFLVVSCKTRDAIRDRSRNPWDVMEFKETLHLWVHTLGLNMFKLVMGHTDMGFMDTNNILFTHKPCC